MAGPELSERHERIGDWDVRISSHRGADEQFHATVAELCAGARIARGSGPSREAAEAAAVDKARARVARTRRSG